MDRSWIKMLEMLELLKLVLLWNLLEGLGVLYDLDEFVGFSI